MIYFVRTGNTVKKLGLAALLLMGLPAISFAQGLGFNDGNSDTPIDVTAENGIEWQQDGKVFYARGNAVAKRGDVTVKADELRAYYREKEGGGADIWRLDAEGHVVISSPRDQVVGDQAVYDVDGGVLVVTGDNLKYSSGSDTITAKKQFEYWEKKEMAVARGDAVAIRQDKKITADVLAAYFAKDKKGKSGVHRVDAFDNVRVRSGKDDVTADRGVYHVASGLATLTGKVVLNRDSNVLNGCRADINLNTGVSKLKSCAAGSGGRVKGRFVPGSTTKPKVTEEKK